MAETFCETKARNFSPLGGVVVLEEPPHDNRDTPLTATSTPVRTRFNAGIPKIMCDRDLDAKF
jgi:hypothetical protein